MTHRLFLALCTLAIAAVVALAIRLASHDPIPSWALGGALLIVLVTLSVGLLSEWRD